MSASGVCSCLSQVARLVPSSLCGLADVAVILLCLLVVLVLARVLPSFFLEGRTVSLFIDLRARRACAREGRERGFSECASFRVGRGVQRSFWCDVHGINPKKGFQLPMYIKSPSPGCGHCGVVCMQHFSAIKAKKSLGNPLSSRSVQLSGYAGLSRRWLVSAHEVVRLAQRRRYRIVWACS